MVIKFILSYILPNLSINTVSTLIKLFSCNVLINNVINKLKCRNKLYHNKLIVLHLKIKIKFYLITFKNKICYCINFILCQVSHTCYNSTLRLLIMENYICLRYDFHHHVKHLCKGTYTHIFP